MGEGIEELQHLKDASNCRSKPLAKVSAKLKQILDICAQNYRCELAVTNLEGGGVGGYHMKIKVYPHGHKPTHVSAFVVIMQGKNDIWPLGS